MSKFGNLTKIAAGVSAALLMSYGVTAQADYHAVAPCSVCGVGAVGRPTSDSINPALAQSSTACLLVAMRLVGDLVLVPIVFDAQRSTNGVAVLPVRLFATFCATASPVRSPLGVRRSWYTPYTSRTKGYWRGHYPPPPSVGGERGTDWTREPGRDRPPTTRAIAQLPEASPRLPYDCHVCDDAGRQRQRSRRQTLRRLAADPRSYPGRRDSAEIGSFVCRRLSMPNPIADRRWGSRMCWPMRSRSWGLTVAAWN